MKLQPILAIITLTSVMFCASPAFCLHSELANVNGDTVFSKVFLRDYELAESAVDKKKSAEPFINLLDKYTKPEEVAELELSIGLVYNQRTGIVDPAKAVLHLSNALKFKLPEKTYIEVLMWRGNSLEGLKKYDAALKDYLRALLACSYHDMSGGWPEIRPSKLPIYMNSDDPENAQRVKDYQVYRNAVDLQRFLLMQRYFLVEAVKRVCSITSIGNDQILSALEELSPDPNRVGLIMTFLKSENKRPWP